MGATPVIVFTRWTRGKATKALAQLEKRFKKAQLEQAARRARSSSASEKIQVLLYDATGGDPLLAADPDEAMETYGLASAPRKKPAIRRIADAVWGHPLARMAGDAREFQRRFPRCSNTQAAAEVMVLWAENGQFLGVHSPKAFNDVLKDVREALGTLHRNGSREYQRIGWTKRYLCVRPADGLVVRNPENMELLPPDGASVPDDLDWRRMIRDGDVLLIEKRATID